MKTYLFQFTYTGELKSLEGIFWELHEAATIADDDEDYAIRALGPHSLESAEAYIAQWCAGRVKYRRVTIDPDDEDDEDSPIPVASWRYDAT